MPGFLPGLTLARLFYEEAVRPILDRHTPGLAHSAGLIGPGSEVLGFDTEMSADHGWGPRVQIFLSKNDHARLADALHATLGDELPLTFRGYSTHFEPLAGEPGTLMLRPATARPVAHRVEIATLHGYVQDYAGIDLDGEGTLLDWLTVPEQKLRTLVAGGVPRRAGRVGADAPPAGLLSTRRVALPAVGAVAADRPGGAVRRPGRDRRRRDRVRGHCRAARA